MTHRYIHTILLPLCCISLYSCIQHDEYPEENEEIKISFQTSEVLTRDFIGEGDLTTLGSRICMYAYHDDKFVSDNKNPFSGKHIVYETGNGFNYWNIVDTDGTPLTYYWEGEGVYRFFGWMTHDAKSSLSTPDTWRYDNDTRLLTIPETVLDKDYNRYDFLYSEIHERIINLSNINDMIRQPVPVAMKHLYTAFGIGFKNISEDPVTITGVAIEGLHERGAAVIDFSGAYSIARYGATSTSRNTSTPFISYNGQHEVTPKGGTVSNIFNPTDTERTYYMLWPQAAEVVSPSTPYASNAPTDEREFAATDSIITIDYLIGEEEYHKRVKLPTEAWEAGKKYFFELQVSDKLVELTATVTSWDYTSTDVDFKQTAVEVKEEGRLRWDDNTCAIDHTEQKVYIKNGQPAEATFCIDAPLGGQWRVSLEGDVNEFSIIDDASPTDDGFGPINGQIHRIKVIPNVSSPARDYAVHLKFVAITADSKTLPADDMIQKYRRG